MADKYDKIIEATQELWDFSSPIPKPREALTLFCGVCGHDDIQPRYARYFLRDWQDSAYAYRVDVSFKCKRCGYVWIHGLLPSEEVWHEWVSEYGSPRTGAIIKNYRLRYPDEKTRFHRAKVMEQ